MTATTPILSIPYPQSTDDPRLAYSQMQALVTALEPLANSWVDYTPDIPGFTLGNGTLYSRVQKIGRTVHWNAYITIGSTSVLPTIPRFSLPYPAVLNFVGQGYVSGSSTNTEDYACWLVNYDTAGYAALFYVSDWVRNTNPWSGGLKAGDQLAWNLTYESTT